jgi:hypothetical protein
MQVINEAGGNNPVAKKQRVSLPERLKKTLTRSKKGKHSPKKA